MQDSGALKESLTFITANADVRACEASGKLDKVLSFNAWCKTRLKS